MRGGGEDADLSAGGGVGGGGDNADLRTGVGGEEGWEEEAEAERMQI